MSQRHRSEFAPALGAGLVTLLLSVSCWLPCACGADEAPASAPAVVHLLDEAEGLSSADELLVMETSFAGSEGSPEDWSPSSSAPQVYLRRLAPDPGRVIFEVEVLEGPVSAIVVRRPEPYDPTPLTPDQVAQLSRAIRGDRAWRQAEAAPGESTVLRLEIPPLAEEKREHSHLLLAVVTPGGSQAVGRVGVRRTPAFENSSLVSVIEDHEGPRDRAHLERVNIAGEHRQAIVLPSGVTFSIEAELPGHARYLELGLATLQGADPTAFAPARLHVTGRVGDAEALAEALELDPGASLREYFWRTVRLPVAELAGERATFSFRAEGQPGHAVAVAHPRVVGDRELDRRHNLILISLDTLRADRVGATGGPAGLTPNIDELAASGMTYRGAHSPSPYTLPSHGTIFTGQLPSEHGATSHYTRLNTSGPFPSPHLARLLRARGWSTAAFTGGGYLSPDFGFSEGFDVYGVHDFMLHESMLHPVLQSELRPRLTRPENWTQHLRGAAAHRTRVESVVDWITTHRDRPFFLFLHTFATHEYAPPPDYLTHFVGQEPAVDWGSGPSLRRIRMPTFWSKHEFTEDEIQHIEAVYDATVAHADYELGRIFAALDAAGLRENTLVVLTSDHGEEFLDHDIFGHARTLYESVLRVPLVISGPGVPQGTTDELVSLIDLAPTILTYLDLPPDPRMKGAPLPTPHNPRAAAAPLFHEVDTDITDVDGLRAERWKLIHNHSRPGATQEWELYDLEADPGEQNNLAKGEAGVLTQLQEFLLERRAALDLLQAALGASAATVSQETQDMLRDLGY